MVDLAQLTEKTLLVERNEFLMVQGSIDTNIYHVVSGSLKIFVLDDYEEQIIRFGYSGNLIVALDAFLTGKPSKFYMQAIKKTVLNVIPKAKLDSFLQTEGNRTWWTSMLESLILQQMEREVDILTTSPKARYHRVLARSPRLFQEIPHRYIANYLRMSPETLSRLKSLDFNQETENLPD